MRIEPWDPADKATERACYETYRAAQRADDPVEPPLSAGIFGLAMRKGFDKTPGEVWVAREPGGEVVGAYRMNLPDLENRDRACDGPVVHPAARRRGIGRALLRHEAGRAAANGRAVLSGAALGGSAGEAFALALGAVPELSEVRRVQHLEAITPGKIAALRTEAERAAAGYSLVTWAGPVPDAYLGQLAKVVNAFADAPHGEGVEPEVWDAERIRDRMDVPLRTGLMRGYSVAATHDATGEMAAYSAVLIDPEAPEWALQQLTAVTRPHRGHRLGLLVKTAMLDLLATAEPRVTRVITYNAGENKHMIGVNEQLGYEVAGPSVTAYRLQVADFPAAQS